MSTKVDFDFFLEGMIYCADNANKIAADARRLYKVNRFPTSGMLAISSLEEIGKIYLLLILGGIYSDKKKLGITEGAYWKSFHRMWRNHKLKLVCASWIDLLIFDEDAIELARHTMKNLDLFDIRNRFLYVDIDEGKWLLPKRTDRSVALELVEAAEDISEEVLKEFNPRRQPILKKEILNPSKMEEIITRWKEIFNLLESEGFGED